MNTFLKSFFFSVLLTVSALSASAQYRPNMDTVSIFGLRPGLDGSQVKNYVNVQLDTVFWNDDGAGMVSFKRDYADIKGDYRIAYDNGIITQVLFTAPVKTPAETLPLFDRFSEICKSIYGEPDAVYHNVYREVYWYGTEQSIGVKTMDNSNYVSLVLSKYDAKKK